MEQAEGGQKVFVRPQLVAQDSEIQRQKVFALFPVHERGVSVQYLEHFTSIHKQFITDETTTKDVVESVIKPSTEKSKADFYNFSQALGTSESKAPATCTPAGGQQSEPMAGIPSNWLGSATVFVSHAWKCPWKNLVAALREDHRIREKQGLPPEKYWIDIFAINQHLMNTDEQEAPVDKQLNETLTHTKSTCFVFNSWSSPELVRRCWCLFEMMRSIAMDSEMRVAMSAEERRSIRKFASEKLGGVQDLFNRIDVKTAEAFSKDDKDMIFSRIEQEVPGGAEGLNRTVKKWLFQWLAGCVENALHLASVKPSDEELEGESFTVKCLYRHPNSPVWMYFGGALLAMCGMAGVVAIITYEEYNERGDGLVQDLSIWFILGMGIGLIPMIFAIPLLFKQTTEMMVPHLRAWKIKTSHLAFVLRLFLCSMLLVFALARDERTLVFNYGYFFMLVLMITSAYVVQRQNAVETLVKMRSSIAMLYALSENWDKAKAEHITVLETKQDPNLSAVYTKKDVAISKAYVAACSFFQHSLQQLSPPADCSAMAEEAIDVLSGRKTGWRWRRFKTVLGIVGVPPGKGVLLVIWRAYKRINCMYRAVLNRSVIPLLERLLQRVEQHVYIQREKSLQGTSPGEDDRMLIWLSYCWGVRKWVQSTAKLSSFVNSVRQRAIEDISTPVWPNRMSGLALAYMANGNIELAQQSLREGVEHSHSVEFEKDLRFDPYIKIMTELQGDPKFLDSIVERAKQVEGHNIAMACMLDILQAAVLVAVFYGARSATIFALACVVVIVFGFWAIPINTGHLEVCARMFKYTVFRGTGARSRVMPSTMDAALIGVVESV